MSEIYCKNCGHYHQHYGLGRQKIFRVYCGHCSKHRNRRQRPDSVACDAFVPEMSKEDAFATKEYLSKALLEYMLNLELLPEIYEMEKK